MLSARSVVLVLSVALLATRAGAQDDEPNADFHRPERLTVGVTDDLLGELGIDEQTLYFVSNRDTTHQIYAQNTSTGRAKLLFDDDADVTWPRVSPDGHSLLYISFREHASGQLCIRRLPEGDRRRCLEDPSAAMEAEWIDSSRIALVGRQSIAGNLRILEVAVGSKLSARPLFERNLTSPAISPDGHWMVYVPVERTIESVGPAFAAHAAPRLEVLRIGNGGAPAPLEFDLPGQSGQPAFARDGRSIYFVQFFVDSNRDGVIDASDHGVLFRASISLVGDRWIAGPPVQLTETSWNCEYPAPSATRLVATCSQDASLDVYSLPLDGEVPLGWSQRELAAATENAETRVEEQLLANRRLAVETSPSGRRMAMLTLAMLHLDLEQYQAAQFYAEHVAALHDHETRGISHPLIELVEQRRAMSQRERGRMIESFAPGARERLEKVRVSTAASPMALALAHVVRSEIADSIGDKTQARAELEAVAVEDLALLPILELYYQRVDALYRELDDRDALVASCTRLATEKALSPDERLRYARAAVRAMSRGRSLEEAAAHLAEVRTGLDGDSELSFALDLARALLAIRDAHPPRAAVDELFALYARQERPARRQALLADATRRAGEVGNSELVEALATRNIQALKRGTRERRNGERLFRRVMTARAYRRIAERRVAEARADFDAIATETSSYEAVVGAIDMRLKLGEAPAAIAAAYAKPGDAPALSHFAKAYLLARQLPKLEGEEHARAARDAQEALHASWSELKGQRIVQALDGALIHEEYLRTGDPAAAEKANVHYLIALELVGKNPRFRAMILGELGLLHAQVGNYRIALGYLLDRNKLPYADNAEGLAVHLARARALLHVGRDAEAAAAADQAIAMIDRTPGLSRYRALALDRAALDHLAAGKFDRALALYDVEVPLLDSAETPAARRNRVVVRLARAAAAVGAGHADRALQDLADVEKGLGDAATAAALPWTYAPPEDALRSYRLIALGLRARASAMLGHLDDEARALSDRHAILAAWFEKTHRAEIERSAMVAEAQLAVNASMRRDVTATGAWLGQALGRADDLRARAHGASDADQLDLLKLAAELTVSSGHSLVPDLEKRMNAASGELAARRETTLRAYERWFEMYEPLVNRPATTVPGAVSD